MASCSTHLSLQRSINNAIANPCFSAALPPLPDHSWMKILISGSTETAAENDRLEFLGDALMYATIGRQLYAQIPQGSPHLYTTLRAALHSNATFSTLAEKLDVFAVSADVLTALTKRTFGEGSLALPKHRTQVKATADLFETVIGAYYLECGFERLNDWVCNVYKPLIAAARQAYNDLQATTDRKKRTIPTMARIVKKKKKARALPKQLPERKDTIYFPQHPPSSDQAAHTTHSPHSVPANFRLHEFSSQTAVAAPATSTIEKTQLAPEKVIISQPNARAYQSSINFAQDRWSYSAGASSPQRFSQLPSTLPKFTKRDSYLFVPRESRSSSALLPTPRRRITLVKPRHTPLVIDLTADDDTPTVLSPLERCSPARVNPEESAVGFHDSEGELGDMLFSSDD